MQDEGVRYLESEDNGAAQDETPMSAAELDRVLEESPTGTSTLDFFLGSQPDRKIEAQFYVPRIGLRFTLTSANEQAIKMAMERSQKKQTKQERQRGIAPDRDSGLMERLILVEHIQTIEHRLRTSEEAKASGLPEWAEPVSLRDPELLHKWGPRPEDFLQKWLLPGEITQMADMATDLSGYGTDAVAEAGK